MRLRKSVIAGLCLLLAGTTTMMGACSSKKDGNINDSDKSVNTTTAANEPDAGNDGNQMESGDSENTADITKFDINVSYKDKQLNTTYDETAAAKIQLSDSGIQVSDSGAVVQGTTVTITKAGTYIISGSVSDGQIIVDSSDEGYVWLVLDNVSITSQNSSAIYVKSADNTLITLPEETKNEVTDGKDYVFEGEDTSLNAAIYSKDDLFINGTGSLIVNGNYNHGIQSKDDLVIISGNITVHSAGDGIVGKDSVVIKEAVITAETGGDGIKSTNAAQDKGYIYLDNPNITITAGNDRIQAETCMVIEDGIYNIITGGGSGNASTKENGEFNRGWGNWGGGRPGMRENTEPDSNDDTVSDSAKGIKAGVDITINGGVFTCDTSDDAIHSNNSITINKGTMTMASGDDGIHSDTILTIYGGEIEITKSYEGIESANIYVNDGTITLTASDDGFNAAGGSDGSAVNGRPGQNPFSGAGDYEMVFNGGTIRVCAEGDGLDSNGKIIVNGGSIRVEGPTDGGNSAVDYESGLEINGGTLIAAGSAGMAEAPTGGSQYSVMINFDSAYQGGTEVTVRDSDGNEILNYTPDRLYQSVIFSSPDLQKGNTYDIFINKESYTTVTISDIVTTSGASGGMHGGMQKQPGGKREQPGDTDEGMKKQLDDMNRGTEGEGGDMQDREF